MSNFIEEVSKLDFFDIVMRYLVDITLNLKDVGVDNFNSLHLGRTAVRQFAANATNS